MNSSAPSSEPAHLLPGTESPHGALILDTIKELREKNLKEIAGQWAEIEWERWEEAEYLLKIQERQAKALKFPY